MNLLHPERAKSCNISRTAWTTPEGYYPTPDVAVFVTLCHSGMCVGVSVISVCIYDGHYATCCLLIIEPPLLDSGSLSKDLHN